MADLGAIADKIEQKSQELHRLSDDVRNNRTPPPAVVTVPDTKPVPVPIPDPGTGDITQPILNLTKANWLGEWSGRNPWQYIKNLVNQAGNKQLLCIGYFLPNRDNGNFSGGGAHSEQEFYDFYGAAADAIGNNSALWVLEPDALGLMDGIPQDQQEARYRYLQGAIDALNKKPNISIYADASTWVQAAEMAKRLQRLKNIDGFSTNVSGYKATNVVAPWAEDVSTRTKLKYILDTSRNGRGNPHEPAWCNVTDTLIGMPPTTKTHSRNCQMYFWGKVPGESDGQKINGHDQDGKPPRQDVPAAGTYWPEFKEAIYSGNWDAFKRKYQV